jgi:hypothetical protein
MGSRASVAPVALTIEESGRLVEAWAWAESHLYGVVGSWVPSAAWPAAKVWLSSASQHHAWRAQLWRERLPGRLVPAYPAANDGALPPDGGPAVDSGWATGGLPVTGPVRPGPEGAEAALALLGRLQGDGARLGAYCRVILPRTVVAYRSWQRRCTASSDRPVARALALNLADVVADWQDGSEVLTDFLGRPGGVDELNEVAEASIELERLLMGQGLGPDSSWGR